MQQRTKKHNKRTRPVPAALRGACDARSFAVGAIVVPAAGAFVAAATAEGPVPAADAAEDAAAAVVADVDAVAAADAGFFGGVVV